MKVTILNWDELKEKFGLTDTPKGIRKPYSARQISKTLHETVFKKHKANEEIVDGLLVSCGEFSELDCIFTLKSSLNSHYMFEYNGVVG